jgi:hypothetical protein
MQNLERYILVSKQLIAKNQKLTINNFMLYSLTSSGGTLTDKKEIKIFIDNYIIKFNDEVLIFDSKNEMFYLNTKVFKVENNYTFTYKFLKTKLKCTGGIQGFKTFVSENINIKDTFYFTLKNCFNNLKTI